MSVESKHDYRDLLSVAEIEKNLSEISSHPEMKKIIIPWLLEFSGQCLNVDEVTNILIELTLWWNTLPHSYIKEAFKIEDHVKKIVEAMTDGAEFAEDVWELYNNYHINGESKLTS